MPATKKDSKPKKAVKKDSKPKKAVKKITKSKKESKPKVSKKTTTVVKETSAVVEETPAVIEENVVSAAGTTKVLCTEEELQHAITRAGFKAIRRDSDYNSLETPTLVNDVQTLPTPPPLQ